MNHNYKDLIYLIFCSLNNITPTEKHISNIDLEQLYKLAIKHSVIAIVNIALEKANISDERFIQAYKKSIRKNIMLDIERKSILDEFEKNGIWYMPLKGSILKDLYPLNGIRQMADNDILFDISKQEKVKDIMISHGYDAKSYSKYKHDIYIKPPVLNFELHTSLFEPSNIESFDNYYLNIKEKLKKDKNNKYGYHFSDEDFYIYITAHEWKHYNNRGTGIRSLIDCYVYLSNTKKKLDWKYIKKQTDILGISDFEVKRRKLALRLFRNEEFPQLDEEENEMLVYYLEAGTYGTYENNIRKKLQKMSKVSFWLHSIFISRKQMNKNIPFTSKSLLLYPIGLIYRIFQILIFKRDKIRRTVKVVNKYGK